MKGEGKCPGCGAFIGTSAGECAIFGSHDIPDLCESCFLEEDELIENEGTNCPENSERIKQRLRQYRETMRIEDIPPP